MASSSHPSYPLIEARTALEQLYEKKGVVFIDATWRLGLDKTQCIGEHISSRIPGSQYFNIEEICDTSSTLPHMLPSESQFAERMQNQFGISNSDNVVVYTHENSFGGPRCWWMFKVFGHEKVSLLQGGFNAWRDAGGPVATGVEKEDKKTSGNVIYTAKLDKRMVVDADHVLKVVETGSSQIVDARSLARFRAEAPEPRANLLGGHIPGSLCLPFSSLLKENDYTTFKSKEEIRDAFKEGGVVFGTNSILSCGSGVSAAVLCVGLSIIGKDPTTCPIYDGSWSEWGLPEKKLPIMK